MFRKTSLVVILSWIVSCVSYGQEFRRPINVDSIFYANLDALPEEVREKIKNDFDSASHQLKMMMASMVLTPRSSKAELIENYESNQQAIENLIRRYSVLVPEQMTIYLEWNPIDPLNSMPETIDLMISKYRSDGSTSYFYQEWNLELNSQELSHQLDSIGWTSTTLFEIRNLLNTAHCMSIKNNYPIELGFARSGNGKYSYRIFPSNLNSSQIEQYNDSCAFIYYRDNVVLEYASGTSGPLCFPDK
ncbi:MAG: hypothetical protein EP346_08385 [Bacteroidetes bacterium]|nr:MAG: hypothetical protein EP346_08385 [Bacteroidota bacterium]